MVNVSLTQALKEWAVVVDALLDGRQTLTIRKGGISEEDGVFRTDVPAFLLFPSFLHQDEDAILPSERGRFARVAPPPEGRARFPGWARVVAVERIPREEDLSSYAALTIWTPEYLAKRFRMMPRQPLFALRLEVARLAPPWETPWNPAWAGCKSYLPLGGVFEK